MSVNNLLYTTSRGAAIRPMIEAEVPNCVFYTRGGATLEELGQRAVNDLQWEIKPENCIVYFIAGLPSVTFRERDPNWGGLKYEEVIFNEPEDDAVARICNIIDSIAISVRSFKATPVFSTIIPMSLRVWNDVRLSQGKTRVNATVLLPAPPVVQPCISCSRRYSCTTGGAAVHNLVQLYQNTGPVPGFIEHDRGAGNTH